MKVNNLEFSYVEYYIHDELERAAWEALIGCNLDGNTVRVTDGFEKEYALAIEEIQAGYVQRRMLERIK